MLASILDYINANPNFLQIATTAVIAVVAFAIWSFTSKNPPQGPK